MIECSREREAIRAWAEPRPTANGDLIEAMSLFYVFYVFHARTCQLQQPYAGWPWAAGTPVAE